MDMIVFSSEQTYTMCDVLFRDANSTWHKSLHLTSYKYFKALLSDILKEISFKAGTGFLAKILNSHPKYYSIILTTAHIFIKDF